MDPDLQDQDEHDVLMRELTYQASDDYDDGELEDPFLTSAREDPDDE
ncbi:hypothetical protein ACIKTA_06865 [Hansschlegelia beijingensis]